MTRTTWWVVAGLAVALGVAVFVSPWASSSPDGLDKFAADHAMTAAAEPAAWQAAPLADYQVPAVRHTGLATALAGGIGTLLVFGAGPPEWLPCDEPTRPPGWRTTGRLGAQRMTAERRVA